LAVELCVAGAQSFAPLRLLGSETTLCYMDVCRLMFVRPYKKSVSFLSPWSVGMSIITGMVHRGREPSTSFSKFRVSQFFDHGLPDFETQCWTASAARMTSAGIAASPR